MISILFQKNTWTDPRWPSNCNRLIPTFTPTFVPERFMLDQLKLSTSRNHSWQLCIYCPCHTDSWKRKWNINPHPCPLALHRWQSTFVPCQFSILMFTLLPRDRSVFAEFSSLAEVPIHVYICECIYIYQLRFDDLHSYLYDDKSSTLIQGQATSKSCGYSCLPSPTNLKVIYISHTEHSIKLAPIDWRCNLL